MKQLLTLVGLAGALCARADMVIHPTWNSGFLNSGNVPDGNLSGWWDTRSLSGYSGYTIADVNVRLILSDGFNGDLYAYLQHGSGFAVLLNRMGVGVTPPLDSLGAMSSGMNLAFDDLAANGDIHLYTGLTLPTGQWEADGRNVSPLSSPGVLEGAVRQNGGSPLALFHGLNPDGGWTLFVSDVSGGGGTTQVTEWGLDVTLTAVPEASSWAMGGVMALVGAGYFLRVRRQARRERESKSQ